ncbi:MAG: nucleotidyltransferase domain-containing protein [Bacteroidota bacterium]
MIKDVRIFGSRSKQTAHAGSDIDLAIMNNGVGFDELLRLRSDFEDSNLPYTVDVVYYPEIKHQELKEHIDRMGAVFYRV